MDSEELEDNLRELVKLGQAIAGSYEWGTSHYSDEKESEKIQADIRSAFRELRTRNDMLSKELVDMQASLDALGKKATSLESDREYNSDLVVERDERIKGLSGALKQISAIISGRHGDDDAFGEPVDEECDTPAMISVKEIFDLLEEVDMQQPGWSEGRWEFVTTGPQMRVIKDGNAWMFCLRDFQDLQSSPAIFRDDPEQFDEYYRELMAEKKGEA